MTEPHGAAIAVEPPILRADRFTAANRRRLSGAGLRAFLNIARVWALSERGKLSVLGFPSRSTFHNWVAKAEGGRALTLPADTLLRISAVLGIYKALRILFEDEDTGIAWLRAPNAAPCFGGQRPIDLVTGGTQDGILLVRRYLDAWRGGVFAPPLDEAIEDVAWRPDDIAIVG